MTTKPRKAAKAAAEPAAVAAPADKPMPAPFALGTAVRVKMPTIEGEVAERRFDDRAGEMTYRVPFTGADGEPGERWFTHEQLEAAS